MWQSSCLATKVKINNNGKIDVILFSIVMAGKQEKTYLFFLHNQLHSCLPHFVTKKKEANRSRVLRKHWKIPEAD